MSLSLKKIPFIIFISSLLLSNYCFSQCSEYDIINLKKIAIVFGQKDYKFAPSLKNTVNDANDISDSLKKVGFEVFTYRDTDLRTMNAAIDNWYEKLSKYDVALFYFSGHGAEVDGANYLFPIDADPKGKSDLYYSTYSANKLISRLDASPTKFNIVILDACRNNPFVRNWSKDLAKIGLAAMSGRGMFIGFAASPGTTASDGDSRNGTYTEAILKNITIPNLSIDQIFTKVNSYVRTKSLGQQVPFKNSSLSADFCFSVILEKKKNKGGKIQSYYPPISSIAIDTSEQNIFVVDSASGGLLIKDATTLNTEYSLLTGKGKPFKIISLKKQILCILDSARNMLIIVDWKKRVIVSEVPLANSPKDVIASPDEQKAYVASANAKLGGSISIVDLMTGKISKTIPTGTSPHSILISPDNKILFVSTKSSYGKDSLVLIDIKTDKIIKYIPEIGVGNLMGLTPDKKNLFVIHYNEIPQNNFITIIDPNTFKILKKINLTVNQIAFTLDSKYTFALTKSEIIVLRNSDYEITNKLPLATTPKGLTISSDGNAFVWLPEEKRIFLFSISEQLENQNTFDPEFTLKKFKEELNKESAEDGRYAAKEIFARVNSSYYSMVNGLASELGKSYGPIQTGINYNYKELEYSNQLGIVSEFDETKKIWPVLKAKITETQLVVTMQEQGAKEEVYVMPIQNTEWKEFNVFIRTYFVKRLNQLK